MPIKPDFDVERTLSSALRLLRKRIALRPDVALVLGSGLGAVVDSLKNPIAVDYADIPGLASAGVAGHAGRLVFGRLGGKYAAVFCGRLHFYEGYAMEQVSFPARLAAGLGARALILTCAAGSVKKTLPTGSLALIRDHVNFMGVNPLRGVKTGERFVDMSACYDSELAALAQKAARAQKVKLSPAVYWAFSGPSYETPAEIRMATLLGADVVGMSMVPEAMAGVQCGLRVLGFAAVSNLCAGLEGKKLQHAEVLQNGRAAAQKLSGLIAEIVEKI